MNNYIKFAEKADYVLAVVSLVVALYYAYNHHYVTAAVWLAGAVFSYVCAKGKPARWLSLRMLRMRK